LALESYDVIIIGTGAGGGTLAHRVAPSGKRILILERGGFLPREKENWDSTVVFQEMRYHTSEKWAGARNYVSARPRSAVPTPQCGVEAVPRGLPPPLDR